MKTLAVVSHKGGTGKSTLSNHLAIQAQSEGRDTLLVDLDNQSFTVAEWASFELINSYLLSQLKNLISQNYSSRLQMKVLIC